VYRPPVGCCRATPRRFIQTDLALVQVYTASRDIELKSTLSPRREDEMSVVTQLEAPLAYLESTAAIQPRPNIRDFLPNASIILIGSRGSGKRTLGFIGATHLGRRLITEDHYFQAVTGVSRCGFIFLPDYSVEMLQCPVSSWDNRRILGQAHIYVPRVALELPPSIRPVVQMALPPYILF
jgi:hypothetical protein